MDTTALGFVYPEATDDVNLWEHFQGLAESINDYIAAHGRIATTYDDTDSATFTTVETVIASVSAPLVSGRTYKIRCVTHLGSTVGGDTANINIRETNASGTVLQSITNFEIATNTAAGHYVTIEGEYTAVSTASKTLVVSAVRAGGSGSLRREAAGTRPTLIYVDYARE